MGDSDSMEEVLSSLSFPTEMIVEGEVTLLVPKLRAFMKSPSDYGPSKAPVFYNPVMELNRDIAVLALQAYQRMVDHQISVCEPLASCGIRAVRFAVEIPNIKDVIMNDINKNAVQIATCNVQINKIGDKTVVENKDANLLLTEHAMPHRRFDAVDLDPFGSPVTYLDSAVRALRDHGLLALTATDMAPLCGVHPRACIRKYGGKPLRTEYCHELAVRLLAGSLATVAAKHEIGLHVLFSHAAEHYIRVYAVIDYGAKIADESLNNMGFILHCFKCFHRESLAKPFAFEHSGKCPECGSKLTVGGPLWLGKLLDENFCQIMEDEIRHKKLRKKEKILKILALAKNEAAAPIGYYVVDRLCDTLNLPVPSVRSVAEALMQEGFQTCLTRFNSKGIRSNASAAKMKEIVKKVVKDQSVRFADSKRRS